MKTSNVDIIRITGEDGRQLIVHHTNRGDPYSQGFQFDLYSSETYETTVSVYLEDREAIQLRDLLLSKYPVRSRPDGLWGG